MWKLAKPSVSAFRMAPLLNQYLLSECYILHHTKNFLNFDKIDDIGSLKTSEKDQETESEREREEIEKH